MRPIWAWVNSILQRVIRSPASLDRADQLVRRFPELKLKLVDSRIAIEGKYDTDLKNDVFSIRPGRLVSLKKPEIEKPINLAKIPVERTIGGKKVQLKKYQNKHWQLLVDDKPFPIKAITYSATPVGMSPDRGTWNVSRDWQLIDTNKNGKHDGFDESFIDKNGNSIQDADEPTVGDGKILKDLGVNTLRAYHHLYDKDLFRRLYKDYGLYILCGDLLGGYAVGSGATWTEGTNYNNPTQQDTMLSGIRQMVEDYKDAPYILMWVIGNENVYGVANNAKTDPVPFFKLVNRAAQLIHELDPSRPVAIANGDLLYLDVIKEYCPDVDILGANVYRGEQGFGRQFFLDVQEALDRPVMVTEYGVSAYAEGYTMAEAQAYQAMYLGNNWDDLRANMAGHGVGNALGGVLFEYVDEWWKANSDLPEKVQKARAEWYASKSAIYKSLQPENQDTVPQFGFPFLDGWSYEEWYGISSQGNGSKSPFLRQLRPAYFRIQKEWKN
jgi:beta-glucuronidase